MLTQQLEKRGHIVQNLSTSGFDTRETLRYLVPKLQQEKPDIVIASLSLANEGLLYEQFKKGMLQIIQKIKEINAVPFLGSVYPNNSYTPTEYQSVKAVFNVMKTWGCPILDFMSATDDGFGHWKAGTYVDDGHPNDEGHKLMFSAIPLELFDKY